MRNYKYTSHHRISMELLTIEQKIAAVKALGGSSKNIKKLSSEKLSLLLKKEHSLD